MVYDSETVGPVLIEDGAATVNFSLQPVDDPAVEPDTATVSGTVTDGTDNVPIEDAVVMLEGSDPVLSTSTDENGNYVLTDVPVDEAELYRICRWFTTARRLVRID